MTCPGGRAEVLRCFSASSFYMSFICRRRGTAPVLFLQRVIASHYARVRELNALHIKIFIGVLHAFQTTTPVPTHPPPTPPSGLQKSESNWHELHCNRWRTLINWTVQCAVCNVLAVWAGRGPPTALLVLPLGAFYSVDYTSRLRDCPKHFRKQQLFTQFASKTVNIELAC